MKRLLLSLFIGILCVPQLCAQEFLHIGDHLIPVSNITKITQSVMVHPRSLSLLLENDNKISIYVEALKATGMIDSLKFCIDSSYEILNDDSCEWKGSNTQNLIDLAYPKERRFNFTFFACPDSILSAKYNIRDLNGLRAKAKEIYSTVYPEDANVTDETDRRNYLNRFVSYQLLNFYGTYNTLTAYDGSSWAHMAYRPDLGFEVTDWYETAMPFSIMKLSYYYGPYINRRMDADTPVSGVKVFSPIEASLSSDAINGTYHYIDGIAAYDNNTKNVVLNERMRFDFSTLSPDFMSKLADGETARGHSDGIFNTPYDGHAQAVAFKPGYVRNFEFGDNSTIAVSNRHSGYTTGWAVYQGDEFYFYPNVRYDVTMKLPPVPAGKYELRLGYGAYQVRPIVAFYIDGVPADIVDMRPNDATNSWINSKGYDCEELVDNDRHLRNKGYMKAPANYFVENGSVPLRDSPYAFRKIIGTLDTDG